MFSFYWRTHQRGEEEGGLRLDQACLHGLNPLLIRPLLKLHCFLIWREFKGRVSQGRGWLNVVSIKRP